MNSALSVSSGAGWYRSVALSRANADLSDLGVSSGAVGFCLVGDQDVTTGVLPADTPPGAPLEDCVRAGRDDCAALPGTTPGSAASYEGWPDSRGGGRLFRPGADSAERSPVTDTGTVQDSLLR